MANTFQLKRSSVQGRVPTTSQLALGEIGINTYDGKLYIKKDDGTASIVEIGGSTSSNFTGATSSTAGAAGLVPAPSAGDQAKYLQADGTWSVPTDTDTTYSNATTSVSGLMSSTDKSKLDGIQSSAKNFFVGVGGATASTANGNGYLSASNTIYSTSAVGTVTFHPPDLSAYLRSNAADTASGLITFTHDDGIWIKPSTNATGAQIRFSDQSSGSYAQYGTIEYLHADGAVTTTGGNSNDGFVIKGTESRTVVKVEGDVIATGTIYDGTARVLTTADEGSGNGIDADTVDGQHGSYYLDYNNFTNTPTIPSSSSFIDTSSTNQEKTGRLTLGSLIVDGTIDSGASDYAGYRSNGTNIVLKGDASGRSAIFFQSEKNGTNINHPSDYGYIQFHPYGIDGSSGEANRLVIGVANDSTDQVILQSPYKNGVKISFKDATSGTGGTAYTVWHAGNDGASSGLDADLLDGQQGSYYLDYTNFTNTPSVVSTSSANTFTASQTISTGKSTNPNNDDPSTYDRLLFDNSHNSTAEGPNKIQLYNDSANNWSAGFGVHSSTMAYYSGDYHRFYDQTGAQGNSANFTELLAFNTSNLTYKGNTIWHSGNDGSGSGLDADRLDGQSSSYYIDTSNTSQTKAGRLTLGSTNSNNEGLSIQHAASTSGYGAIRGYDNTTNNSTIHFFSNSWTSSGTTSGITGSQGCINLSGSYGVTIGDWNNPEAYVENNILGVRGDGTATRGSLKLFRDNNNYAVTLAPSNSLTTNYTLTLPTGTGSNGQVLTTNGSGTLSWTTVSGGSGGIANVVDDTTPQLGGNLDANGKNIVLGDSAGTTDDRITFGASADLQIYHNGSNSVIQDSGTGDLILASNTTYFYDSANATPLAMLGQAQFSLRGDGSFSGKIDLYCENNTHYVRITAPTHASFSNSYTLTLPESAGSSGQVLMTDGTGNTSWTTVSSGGGSGITAVVDDTTPELGGALDLDGNFLWSNASGLGATYGDVAIQPIATSYGSLHGGLKIHCRDHTSGATHYEYYFNGPNLSTPGSITASGNVTAYSDVKLKKEIKPIEGALDKVCKISGVTFERTDLETKSRFAGVIAQEVEAVLPEVVSTDEQGLKSVAYGNLVSLLIEAVKEQQTQINELKEALKNA